MGERESGGTEEWEKAVAGKSALPASRDAYSPILPLSHCSTLPRPLLVLVTDRHRGDLVPAVRAAVAGGAQLVILREKDLPAGELLALAERLREATAGRALLVVNDGVDVALAAEADGAHLGEAGLPVPAARRAVALRERFLIGRSVHSLEGAREAAHAGADYLLFGNVFATASHPGKEPAGTEMLARVAAGVPVPVIAIGGITPENAAECRRAGAAGVAVISAILDVPDPEAAARELRRCLDDAGPGTGKKA